MDGTLTRAPARAPVDIDALCQRWNSGEPLPSIAEWLGRTPAATAKLVERLRNDGHPFIHRSRSVAERRQRLLELAATHTRRELAEELGITLERLADDIGHLRREGHDITVIHDAERRRLRVRDLVRAGYRRRDIAETLDITIETVRSDLKWLRRNKVLGADEYAGGMRPAREPITPGEGRLIRDLWNDDVSTAEIAAIVDRDPKVITQYVCARRKARGDVKRRYRARSTADA